jgi:hypothetical protein
VAKLVESFTDPASTEIVAFPASESASRKQATIGFAGPVEFPVWKTITVGIYKNVKAVREALNAAPRPIHVGNWANEILGRPAFPYGEAAAELGLVVVSVSALGFGEDGASLKDIYARASQLDLALCPAEAGPILRLAYLDQPLGEFLHIAMKPVTRYGGEPTDLTVANGGAGLLLIGGDARSDLVLPGPVRFVFVRSTASGRNNDDSATH